MIKPSNYNIMFGKSNPSRGTSWGISIELNREFYEFARSQKVSKEQHENIARNTLRETSGLKVPKKGSLKNLIDARNVCQWDKNFLKAIRMPGSAPGLFFQDVAPHGPRYSSHNLDYEYQPLTIMTVITKYLTSLDYKIPRGLPHEKILGKKD